MYNEYFGFRERPFSITPDPRFLYPNAGHEEAYANLFYGIHERKGFIVLTGEVGTGKTTLLRKLIEGLENSTRFVLFYNTTLTFEELLDFTFTELGLEAPPGGRLQKIQALNRFLINELMQGSTVALLIDEAQNLSDEVLENLRLLSNLETAQEKLLQIVLVGQPELDAKLAQPHLRQLKQRITTRCHLTKLRDIEVGAFISHRLRTVGCTDSSLFSPEAVQRITVYCQGIPRLINVMCDSALLLAYGASQKSVSPQMIDEVAKDLQLLSQPSRKVAPPDVVPVSSHLSEVFRPRDNPQPAPSHVPLIGIQGKSILPSDVTPSRLVTEPQIRHSLVIKPPLAWGGALALMLFGGFLLYSKPSQDTVLPTKIKQEDHGFGDLQNRITGFALSLNERVATLLTPLLPVVKKPKQPNETSQVTIAQEVEAPSGVTPHLPGQVPSVTAPVVAVVTTDHPTAQAHQSEALLEHNPGLHSSVFLQEQGEGQTPLESPQEPERAQAAPTHSSITSLLQEQHRSFLRPGETISAAVRSLYGSYNSLALDLIKEFNPQLEDLDRVVAGQKIRFPSFTLDTLLREQDNGAYRLIIATFRNLDPAERFAQSLREQGYKAQIVPRRVSESIILHRVEIIELSSREEAQHAWHLVTPTNVFFVIPKTIDSIEPTETTSPQREMEELPETGL